MVINNKIKYTYMISSRSYVWHCRGIMKLEYELNVRLIE